MKTNIQKFNKSLYGKYTIYEINPLEVRDSNLDMQEFGDFGFHLWFKEIPKNELWINKNLNKREKALAIENGLNQMKDIDNGISEHKAYQNAIKKEKAIREKMDGIKFEGKKLNKTPKQLYIKQLTTLEDGTKIFLVDGELIRDLFKTDFIEGGNEKAYSWVPKGEIWLEDNLSPKELPYILLHEYTERWLMKNKNMNYDKAHKLASKVEFNNRNKPLEINKINDSYIKDELRKINLT